MTHGPANALHIRVLARNLPRRIARAALIANGVSLSRARQGVAYW